MGGFDRGFDRDDGAERDQPTEAAVVGDGTVRGGEPRTAVETRTRDEAQADLRQAVESGWDRGRTFKAPRGELAVFQAVRVPAPDRGRRANDRQARALKRILEARNPDAAVTATAAPGGVRVTINGPGVWPASSRTADLALSLSDDSPYLRRYLARVAAFGAGR